MCVFAWICTKHCLFFCFLRGTEGGGSFCSTAEKDVQEKEGGKEIEIEEVEEMETPPGDWRERVYSYDDVVELIDNFPRQYRGGMKSLAKKVGKGGKKGGKVSEIL